jgi:hypothetical protein
VKKYLKVLKSYKSLAHFPRYPYCELRVHLKVRGPWARGARYSFTVTSRYPWGQGGKVFHANVETAAEVLALADEAGRYYTWDLTADEDLREAAQELLELAARGDRPRALAS